MGVYSIEVHSKGNSMLNRWGGKALPISWLICEYGNIPGGRELNSGLYMLLDTM